MGAKCAGTSSGRSTPTPRCSQFEAKFRWDFKGPGPYPTYVVSIPSPRSCPRRPTPRLLCCLHLCALAHVLDDPLHASQRRRRARAVLHEGPQHCPALCHVNTGSAPPGSGPSSLPIPSDTPESSTSMSTLPASSASPSIPNLVRGLRCVCSWLRDGRPPNSYRRVCAALKKTKCGDIFARATPCIC